MPEIIQKVELDLDYSQSLPVGTLDCNELFNKGNTYDLKMLLKVPESDLNFGLGNFVTTISLVTKNDVLIVNRPVIIAYNRCI